MPDRLEQPHQAGSAALAALVKAIAQIVLSKIPTRTEPEQRLMEIEEAPKYLGMTIHALRHKAGVTVPCVRIDGKLRFDRRELDR
jgi:hypothetical protein